MKNGAVLPNLWVKNGLPPSRKCRAIPRRCALGIPAQSSRARFGARCGGIRLQIWFKMVRWDRLGWVFLFFIPALWQGKIAQSSTFFLKNYGMAVFQCMNHAAIGLINLTYNLARYEQIVRLNLMEVKLAETG